MLGPGVLQLAPRLPDGVVGDLVVMQVDHTVGGDESLLHLAVDVVRLDDDGTI